MAILNHTTFLTDAAMATIGGQPGRVWGRHLWSDDLPPASFTGVLCLEVESGGYQPAGPYKSTPATWSLEDFREDAVVKCINQVATRLQAVRKAVPNAVLMLNQWPPFHPNGALNADTSARHIGLAIRHSQLLAANRSFMFVMRAGRTALAAYGYFYREIPEKSLATASIVASLLVSVCKQVGAKPCMLLRPVAANDKLNRDVPLDACRQLVKTARVSGADISIWGHDEEGLTSQQLEARTIASPLWTALQETP